MITLSAVTMGFGTQVLFENVDWRLAPGAHYGLVGANGSGKTTLLRLLAGELKPEQGVVSRPNALRIGVLPQDQARFDSQPLLDVVLQGNPSLYEALAQKARLLGAPDAASAGEGPIARAGMGSTEAGLRLAELETVISDHDGYAAEPRAGALLEGLGIPSERHRRPMGELSGGYRMRVLLAQTLFQAAGLLLLDEPTNHLDIVSIRWLEGYLRAYPHTLVVVSHDRHFLNAVCGEVADLDYRGLTLYTGNYDAFVAAKSLASRQKVAEAQRLEKKIAETQQFINRFRAKASKARQAVSRAKQVDRLERDLPEIKVSSRRHPRFRFEPLRPSGQEVVTIASLSKGFAGHAVLHDLTLLVRRGEKVAVVGPNGIGKSTLLNILAGRLDADAGEVRLGYEVRMGFFGQDHQDAFTGKASLVDWLLQAAPAADPATVRGTLGRVLFSGEEGEKSTAVLSGGERARLLLAALMLRQDNLLVLDEPTNHLDLEGREALLEALRAYAGTLIFVSHDRHFVSSLAGRVLALNPDGVEDFPGTYEEYLARQGDDYLAGAVPTRLARVGAETRSGGDGHEARRNAKREAARLGRRIERLEQEIHALEHQVAGYDTTFAAAGYFERTPWEAVAEAERERNRCRDQLDEKLLAWEEAHKALEELGRSP